MLRRFRLQTADPAKGGDQANVQDRRLTKFIQFRRNTNAVWCRFVCTRVNGRESIICIAV
uniref:Uncharacterized protein n=1 Tax=Anguilla anguilla TaxID=7936 RepID=A0A0E9WQU4_ANGAN